MSARPDILCIGSVHWDIIGRTSASLPPGSDVPGRILRQPGGVAMNIAAALRRFGLTPALVSAIGRDAAGDELIAACERLGLLTGLVYRPGDLPTDRYVAIEGAEGLIAAIADTRSLEAAGPRILEPLAPGAPGGLAAPWVGPVAVDGNLPESLLAEIARSPLFASADLRVAPASPGKATRLMPLLAHPRTTLYVNLAEACLLLKSPLHGAAEAAEAFLARGTARALVTDGAREAAFADSGGVVCARPPAVSVARVTGAGDTFMAAHIAAECRGERGRGALQTALAAAAEYVSHAGD